MKKQTTDTFLTARAKDDGAVSRKDCAQVQSPRVGHGADRLNRVPNGRSAMFKALLVLASMLASFINVPVAFADPTGDAYVREVLARHPSVQAGALRRDALLRDSKAAGIWPDPSLTVMGDYLPGSAAGAQMPMVRVQLTQMVMWPGKLSLMRGAVRAESEAADATLEARKRDLTLEARRAYFMLLMNAKKRELNRASRGIASVIASAALGRYSSQSGGHHEVVRAELEVQALDVEYEALVGEEKSMRAMLNALRYSAPDAPFSLPSGIDGAQIPPYSVDALLPIASRNRQELRQMSAMKSNMEQMASLARKEPYPDFMIGGWYNQMFMGAPNSFGAMVGGTVPLWGIERAGLRAEAYDERAEATSRDAAAMTAMIRAEVVDATTRVETAQRRVALLDGSALPKARESFNATLSAYSTGGADIIGILDARRSLQATEFMLIEARIQRELALAVLERALGGPLPGRAP